jgi:hypothetical protein
MRIIIPKLPIIRERPRISTHNLHPILPNRLQNLRHETQIILTPRRIIQLIGEILFLSFVEDREPELRDCNRCAVDVVQEVEVQPQIGRRDVDVRLRAVADVPAEDVGGGLVDAIRAEGGGGVGGAVEDALLGACDWRGDDGRGVGVDVEEIGGAVYVG